jgi:hypothetical protein
MIYSAALDLDPTAEGREERAHRERTSTARSAALEFNGEVATTVFEVREDDNGVREEKAKVMACSTRSLASCNDEEGRPELVVRQVIPGVGEHGIYRGNEEVNLLLGDRWSRGEHNGEISGVGVVQQLGDCSPEFCPQTVRSSRGRTHRSGVHAVTKTCQGGS